MHQYSQPIRECIIDMKSVQPDTEVAPLTAIKLLFSDGLVELVNLIIAICLCRFTGMKTRGDFSSAFYFSAASLIPFCLGLFFNTERYGCVVDSSGDLLAGGDSVMTERQFPVSVLFHLIVTGCYYFMKMNMGQCNKNLYAVERLRKEFVQSKDSKKKN